MSQENNDTTSGFVQGYIDRVLAKKALRQIRSMVDDIKAEERRNRLGLLLFVIAVIVLVLAFLLGLPER